MAEVDASIYGNVRTPDPLSTIQNLAWTGNLLTENRLAQFGLQGRQVGGSILQQATNPDGSINYAKVMDLVRTTPGGAAAAAEVLPAATSIQGGQIANQTASMNMNQQGYRNLGSMWGARLAANSGPINRLDLIGDVVDGIATGRVPLSMGKAVIRNMPTDDDALRAYATGGYVSSLPPEIQAGMVAAPPTAEGAPRVQTGAQAVAQSLGGTVPTPAPRPTPSGATTTGTGGPPLVEGAMSPAPVPPSVLTTPPGVVTGLPPGQAEAQTAVAKVSGDNFASLMSTANNVPDRKALLTNLKNDLQEFTSGPPSEHIKDIVSSFNTVFGTGFGQETVAAQDRFDKIVKQIAAQQSKAIGGTDLSLQTSMQSLPSTMYSNLGNEGNIALLLGNEDAINTKARAAQWFLNNGGKPSQFGKFSDYFNQHYDPRVFMVQYLDPKQRGVMLKGLSQAEIDKFKADYNFAAQRGWVTP